MFFFLTFFVWLPLETMSNNNSAFWTNFFVKIFCCFSGIFKFLARQHAKKIKKKWFEGFYFAPGSPNWVWILLFFPSSAPCFDLPEGEIWRKNVAGKIMYDILSRNFPNFLRSLQHLFYWKSNFLQKLPEFFFGASRRFLTCVSYSNHTVQERVLIIQSEQFRWTWKRRKHRTASPQTF